LSLRSALLDVLEDDATLTATLTGGVYGEAEISRQGTPGAFDANGEVLPCALLTMEAEDPAGPFPTSSRAFVTVYFYARAGYSAIDAALARVYALLHRQRVSDEGVWDIRHAGDVRDQRDPALDCAMSMSRYTVYRRR
jgi:hypothetical protein